jgi:serine/threonine-protein phosphatase 2A regulatory subunit B''
MEIVIDAASFEAELLQLQEVSPLTLKSNPVFVQMLFEQWLSLPDSNRQVIIMLFQDCVVFNCCF